MPQPVRLSILGFLGGALAVLIFHQSLWYLLNLIGLIPPERPAWPFDPIAPFGVPSVISKAFWGGVWGAVLAPLLSRLRGRSYWAGWITVAAIALRSLPSSWCRLSRASRFRNSGRVSPSR